VEGDSDRKSSRNVNLSSPSLARLASLLSRLVRFLYPKSRSENDRATFDPDPRLSPRFSREREITRIALRRAARRTKARFTFEMTDQSAISRPGVAGRGREEGVALPVLNRRGPTGAAREFEKWIRECGLRRRRRCRAIRRRENLIYVNINSRSPGRILCYSTKRVSWGARAPSMEHAAAAAAAAAEATAGPPAGICNTNY